MENRLAWYSINKKLETVVHSPVGADEAAAIAQRYCARAGTRWESAEACVAGTVFGFRREGDAYIEFCIVSSVKIHCKYRMPGPGNRPSWLGRRRRAFSATLRSRDEMESRLAEFFSF